MFGPLYIKWRRIKFICIAFIFIVAIFIYFSSRSWNCSNEESIQMIKDLCSDYNAGKNVGNMCNSICSATNIKFKHCLNYNGGKIVLVMQQNNEDIILKTLGTEKAKEKEQDIIDNLDLDQFYEMVANTLHFHFNVDIKTYADILGIAENEVGMHFAKEMLAIKDTTLLSLDSDNTEVNVKHINLWKLLKQEEFITFQMLKHNKHIPDILGSCGSMYMLRPSPPGDVLNSNPITINIFNQNSWSERSEIALGILDLIESFSKLAEPFKKLHLCDIKGENFGIEEGGVIQAIDVDMAFVEDKLKDELISSTCEKHKDCDFFDCWGWCDLKSKKCTSIRRNNNLQGVCYKIFTSKSSKALKGLLYNPPEDIKDELNKVLNECIKPTDWMDEKIKYRASDNVLANLRNVLKESNTQL